MLFNSFAFLIFFPVVTILFFLLPHKHRWWLLLAASCFFYMFFKPEYILILFVTIIIDYYAGLLLQKTAGTKQQKYYLIISLIANIGILAVFKYFNFINDNITGLASLFHLDNNIPYLSMILPIGLSFHTFQAMSYTIEVYRGHQKAERHFGIYALYVMFYPQLVAGPIERPQNILYQFHTRKYFTYDNAMIGIKLVMWGLFKKLVIADRLAVYVNQVYADAGNASSISMFIATLFFAIQIYADFSGYTDIARGCAKVMGYDLLINFNYPYRSRSVTEFWRRWHISLSTWFRDYLFIPLGGSRGGKGKVARNLLIVFMISGLWHGASWTFIVWGALHGIAVIYERYTRNTRAKLMGRLPKRLNSVISNLAVCAYVGFAWIFFRAESMDKALLVIKKLFEFDLSLNLSQLCGEAGPFNFILTWLCLLLFYIITKFAEKPKPKYDFAYIMFLAIIIILLGKNVDAQFIYFQF